MNHGPLFAQLIVRIWNDVDDQRVISREIDACTVNIEIIRNQHATGYTVNPTVDSIVSILFIGPEANREIYYKKDMGILARSGFSYDISKKILSMTQKEFNQLYKLI